MDAVVQTNGIKQWLRYFVQDDDRFWTGEGWSVNHRDTLLFHRLDEARTELNKARATLTPDDDEWHPDFEQF